MGRKKKSLGSGGRGVGRRGRNKDSTSSQSMSSMSPSPPSEKKRSRRGRKKNSFHAKNSDDHNFRHSLESDGRWTIVEMDSDGNCLFRSLSDQLSSDYGNDHLTIRAEVCDYIQEHEDEFCVFLVLDEDEEDEDAADFKSYVKNMRDDGEWGGNLELVAASRLYRVNITVFQANQSALTISCGGDSASRSNDKYDGNKKKTVDLYLSYHDNGHYNSVREGKQTPNPHQPLVPVDGRQRRSYKKKEDEDYNYDDDCSTSTNTAAATATKTTITTIPAAVPQKRPTNKRSKGENNNDTQEENHKMQQEQDNKSRNQTQQSQNDNDLLDRSRGISSSTANKNKERPLRKNDPCPCGSFLKYKKCCLAKEKHAQRVMKLRKGSNDTTPDLPTQKQRQNADDSREKEYEMNGNFRVLMI